MKLSAEMLVAHVIEREAGEHRFNFTDQKAWITDPIFDFEGNGMVRLLVYCNGEELQIEVSRTASQRAADRAQATLRRFEEMIGVPSGWYVKRDETWGGRVVLEDGIGEGKREVFKSYAEAVVFLEWGMFDSWESYDQGRRPTRG